MATPHVAGLAGLLASKGLARDQIRQQIESTADHIAGTGNYWSKGRINACRAAGGVGC
jgi:thermitase